MPSRNKNKHLVVGLDIGTTKICAIAVEGDSKETLNVVGVGYTIYLGSEYEHEMLTEAAALIREAHENGLITVTWIYPRGKAVTDEKDPQLISGAAGVALCIGADFTKVNYPRAFEGMTQPESLAVAIEAAGHTGVICSGGGSLPAEEFLQRLWDQINISGASGAR